MIQSLLKEFKSPGSRYRGKPFWAWNGKLDQEELRRQIRIMKRMGLGGFFMHSRVGLDTPYLSEEWHDCIRACVEEAEELDMEAWLYDEDRWPSGAAGGLVTKNPRYRMRSLELRETNEVKGFQWDSSVLAAFIACREKSGVSHVRRIGKGIVPPLLKNGERLLVFRIKLDKCDSWYNGYTYLDVLNHEAVKRFIEVTHKSYRDNFGGHFGRRIPGIFTDEPNYGPTLSGNRLSGVPWTNSLPSVFKERYGYDIRNHLVELFYDVNGEPFTRARYHYHDCITHLFVDAFARQIGEWCDANRLYHTGHALYEESLHSQTSVTGSGMRFYEYMQVPGMDSLTEHLREYDTAKQVSSAARQFGRKWRLTEIYGCTGWDFPFRGHKAVGDWQAALGINLRCQHLSWYTMEGEAKRDYPAAIFYQSPWWELYPKVEDYFARIHTVMTRGEEVRDLLVIHPIESMWMMCKKGWLENEPLKTRVIEYSDMLIDLRDTLLAVNIDFDYGDEEILARHGRIEKKAGEPRLCVGKAKYKAVVVPPLKTIRPTTLSLLDAFLKAGGAVVFAGDVPTYVDALPSDRATDLADRCIRAPAKGRGLNRAVESYCRRVSIVDEKEREIKPTLYLLREDREAFYLFICNTGHDFSRRPVSENAVGGKPAAGEILKDIPVHLRNKGFPSVRIRGFKGCKGAPLELDPDSGAAFKADAGYTANGWEIATSLPPVGSRLFIIPKNLRAAGGKPQIKLPPQKMTEVTAVKRLGGKSWNFILSEDNNMVLDRCRYRIGAGRWKGPEEVLRVDRAVRGALGIAPRGGRMVQPWAQKKSVKSKSLPVELSYRFDVEKTPSGSLFLAVEQPRIYRISLNGEIVSTDAECGWWTDRSLRKLPLDPSILRTGSNELILACDYSENQPGFEIIYLLGQFGVSIGDDNSAAVTSLPEQLRIGDWVIQGLPFYSGSVSYLTAFKSGLKPGQRLIVRVPEYSGTAVRILVNGRTAGIIAWEPNEIDITDFLQEGEMVDLRIEVIGHRRNSHGPLHNTEKWPVWTGPDTYLTTGKLWTDQYQLVPCGLMKSPKLLLC